VHSRTSPAPCGHEQPGDFRLGNHRDCEQGQKDGPQQLVLADALGGQLVGADGDDADYGRTNSVKHGMHPFQATKLLVGPAQQHHHKERGQDEGQPDQGGTQGAVMHITEVDGRLCSHRPRSQLGQGDTFLVVGFGNPAMALNQIAVHVADQGHRAAETEGAKAQEVQHQLPQGVGRMRTDGNGIAGIAQGDLLLQKGCQGTYGLAAPWKWV
jgi:hypothetical protein